MINTNEYFDDGMETWSKLIEWARKAPGNPTSPNVGVQQASPWVKHDPKKEQHGSLAEIE